jgi:predicted DNA-binding protein
MKALKKKPIQIYIEPSQDNVLEELSNNKGISKAQIIRLSIEKYLKELPITEDPAMGLIGLGKSKRGDLAINHDKYIVKYASKRKK